MARTVHVIGAGLAGLAAAVKLAGSGARLVVHEAAGQAGGRCRSYHDPALDMIIDNGNHLLLSGNHAARDYLQAIGAGDKLVGPPFASFPFVDLANNERWTIEIGEGRLPTWIFDPRRRVPGTRVSDYLMLARLLWPGAGKSIGEVVACKGRLYERLMRPLLLAALNTEPSDASAELAAAVLRETLAVGGQACRPLIARDGLGPAFVDPALAFLKARGVAVMFGHRLRSFGFEGRRVATMRFGEDSISLAPDDIVILAVPPVVAVSIVPELQAPSEFRAIVNAHFRVAPPAGTPPIVGVINGLTEWVFAYPDRLSVTVSGADRLVDQPREELASTIWREVAQVCGLDTGTIPPPWQIVRERRATFAALPEENRKRPKAQTNWRNLFLAGDWTATGLPATIEGAIRSGNRAAGLAAS